MASTDSRQLEFTGRRGRPCEMGDCKLHADKIVLRYGVGDGEEYEELLSRNTYHHDEEHPVVSVDRIPSSRLRTWLIYFFVCICASLIVVNSFTYGQFTIYRQERSINHQENEVGDNPVTVVPVAPASGFVVKTKGCRIPAFEINDSSTDKFFKDAAFFECQAGNHLPLVNSNLTSLFIDLKAKSHFYKDSEVVDCCWRRFWRVVNDDTGITYDKTCQNFNDSANVEGAEFVKVECRKQGKEIYKDYFAFVSRKPVVEKRCNSSSKPGPESGRLSVLVLGLDAISRLNFHRTMPKTVEMLRSLKAVEMLGYNKVADNTFPNMIPVLTGLSESELAQQCWTNKRKPFDNCQFIWQNFSAAGYRTVLGEDACHMGIFNYLKSGFRKPPTDYYLRPYCVSVEKNIGNTHKLNADLCVGTRKTFDNLLDYGRKVAHEFAEESYFAFFWQASLSHDFITYPRLGDNSYQNFIRQAAEEGLLNKTALILMSDHGIRWGPFRQTYQGYVEERLPFVFLVLPTWWREKFPVPWANLRRNSKSLTTPFDLHQTLHHLLRSHELDEDLLKERSRELAEAKSVPRGLSWFLPIPDNRTCSMAGIPGHWCMCHTSEEISTTNPKINVTVNFLIQKLNDMVRDYPQCATLKLKTVLAAKVWADQSQQAKDKAAPTVDYTITIQTQPGDAVFEASIRRWVTDSSQKLVGSISRLNLYGEQSACVDDFKMRLYCYCH